MDNTEKAQDKK